MLTPPSYLLFFSVKLDSEFWFFIIHPPPRSFLYGPGLSYWFFNSMASSSPRSGSPDTEDCESEIKSTLSLSVGYFPCEDNSSFEETILLEDTTPDVCLSHNLIPPIQGTWGTESIRRRISQRNLIQDNPQQICKLGIIVAWAENDDFKESTAFENLREGRGLLDRCPKDQTKLTEKKLDDLMKLLKTFQDVHEDEDENKKHNQENQKCDQQNNKENKRNYKDDDFDGLILTSIKDPKLYHSSPAHAPQVCQHKRDTGQNLPRRKSPGNKDVQFPEVSPILQEQEFAKVSIERPPRETGTGPPDEWSQEACSLLL